MNQKELLRLVKQAADSDQRTLQLTEAQKDHPQVAEIRCRVQGRLEAFRSIEDYFANDTVTLRIFAME